MHCNIGWRGVLSTSGGPYDANSDVIGARQNASKSTDRKCARRSIRMIQLTHRAIGLLIAFVVLTALYWLIARFWPSVPRPEDPAQGLSYRLRLLAVDADRHQGRDACRGRRRRAAARRDLRIALQDTGAGPWNPFDTAALAPGGRGLRHRRFLRLLAAPAVPRQAAVALPCRASFVDRARLAVVGASASGQRHRRQADPGRAARRARLQPDDRRALRADHDVLRHHGARQCELGPGAVSQGRSSAPPSIAGITPRRTKVWTRISPAHFRSGTSCSARSTCRAASRPYSASTIRCRKASSDR